MISLWAVAAALYWFEYFGLAFWVVIFTIFNGGLALVATVANPDWYRKRAMEADIEPSVSLLFVSKGILTLILLPVAVHLGRLAEYF